MKCKIFLALLVAWVYSFKAFSGMELQNVESMKKAAGICGEFYFRQGNDFAVWQNNARKSLMEKLGISQKLAAPRVPLSPRILWHRKVENGTITKIVLQSEKDYDLPIYLCLPDGKGPFPVWICVQGHGTGMHTSISVKWQDETTFKYDNGDRNFAIQCLAKGYAAVCVEQRAFGEKSCMKNRHPGCARLVSHAFMFGETMIGNRVFDIDRTIDFIYSRNDLRKDQIGIVGNSGGGTTAIYSGAILDRLTHVMPSSCFSTYKDSILAVPHCQCNYFPGMLYWGEMGDLAGLCAPKYLVIVNGKEDQTFPLAPAQSEFQRTMLIYKAAGVPDRCRMVIGNGGHRFYKADAWPVMEQFFK
ncbi:MAG: hypothetical protein E7043_08395 [Lentisphaerae bacterium]|nr:hypothetical protein [Lentisphaerota bacterium]